MRVRSLLVVPLMLLSSACTDPGVTVQKDVGAYGGDEADDAADAADAQGAATATTAATSGGSAPSANTATSAPPDEPPFAQIDHWHSAFLIHHCGTDIRPPEAFAGPDGIHSHGDGLIHIHPFTPAAAGPNATFGKFVEEMGGRLDDESYTPGPFEDGTVLFEVDGCGGETAVLQLAYWEDAESTDPPLVFTEDIAGHRFTADGSAYTLALLPPGADIPKPALELLELVADLS